MKKKMLLFINKNKLGKYSNDELGFLLIIRKLKFPETKEEEMF
jgi:hypothetical protein